ncbi:MAG: hypothetical protein IPM16_06615 [Chloroflexi bacterium]|nr:hypothetical protein [Chloroflexota bacterium]
MRSRLKQLVSEREARERRRIYQKDIARETGLREATISKWMSPEPIGRIDDKVVVALVNWLELGENGIGRLLYVDSVVPPADN